MKRFRLPPTPSLCVLMLMVAAACGTGTPGSSGANVGVEATSGASAAEPTPLAGSSTPVGSPSSALAFNDGCALLTDAEIAEVTSLPVESKQPTGGLSPIGCQWDLDEGDPDLTARMVLNVVSSGGRALFDPYAADLFEPAPVPGLGDKAVDQGGFILALQGDALVALGYPGFAFETGMAEDLVEIVFARL